MTVPGLAMTPPGTLIPNVADVSYTAPGGGSESVPSNRVDIVTVAPRTPADAVFFRVVPDSGRAATTPVGPAACGVGGGRASFTPLPDPVLVGGRSIDPASAQSVVDSNMFHAGEPFFVRLSDGDQNLDPGLRETVIVGVRASATGDSETIRLLETGSDTGVFTGYVPSAGPPARPGDCTLQVETDSDVRVDYADPVDPGDLASATAQVDPFGLVFDSGTGEPVDGARVTLVDAATGAPAAVVGDDGLSRFPSEVVSGGAVTDSSGQLYDFGPGLFRFPLVAPGDYRLVVIPPAGYVAPSTVDVPVLQSLPGAPFALVDASFGGRFSVFGDPGLDIDIPLDPVPAGLFVQKTTLTTVVAPGDFLQYTLTVENTSDQTGVNDVAVTDVLPAGFRFVAGSVRIDDAEVEDPAVGPDGRTLTFALGTVEAGQTVKLRYAVEVTVGVSGDEAENVATASGAGGITSNTASAVVQIAEDLFRSHSTLIGRVTEGGCGVEERVGVPGVRVYLEDGRYAVTDEGGRYHFDGVKPGTHVVQLDVQTVPDFLELHPCEEHSRYAGRSFSRFVDLRAGSLWRADFQLKERPAPEGALALSLASEIADGGERVAYTATLKGNGIPVTGLTLMALLPDGLSYAPGSTRIGAATAPDPRVAGPSLSFPLRDQAGEWTEQIYFETVVDSGISGDLSIRALATFDTVARASQKTPTVQNSVSQIAAASERVEYVLNPKFDVLQAELKPDDRAALDALIDEWRGAANLEVEAVGHTDNVPIAAHNRHIFSDNHALSLARASAVAQYLAVKLDLDPAHVKVTGRGPDQPVADNATRGGRALNRRVEVTICGERLTREHEIRMARDSSGVKEMRLEGLSARESWALQTPPSGMAPGESKALDVEAEIENLSPGIDWLLPVAGFNPPIPSLRLAIKHAPGDTVELHLNGVAVNALNFDGGIQNRAKTVAVSQWRGVDLRDGENTLDAVVRDASGGEVARLTRHINYAGGPVRGVLLSEESVLVADGKTRPVVSLRMVDRSGRMARPGTVGAFRVDPPYRSWWEVETSRQNQLLAVGTREPVYTVDPDGIARIELEPTSQTGEIVLHLRFPDNHEQEVRAWLAPAARDWILVGLAEGTVGYNVIKDNLQNAGAAGVEEDLYEDGRVAFFAKGRIKGEFLLTLAYDSARDKKEAEKRLLGVIEADRFYPLYGDAADPRYEAPSQDKLFLKLERNQFLALFGDFETGLTVTELSRYNRSFNGLKSEYYGDRISYSAFAARTSQAFVKDEMQGDGTSGPYRLSRQPIIINSEKIVLETRDRFRSQEVLESRTLARYLDYSIDYLTGTLYFKRPITSRDEGFNPVFIVADYESRDDRDDSTTAGGRTAMKLAGGTLELGATAIHEGQLGGEGDLYGTDLRWQLGEVTELRAEAAASETRQAQGRLQGAAYLAELTHRTERVDGRLYVREQENGFGLGQQRSTESATRKSGIDGRLRLSERLEVAGELFEQSNLSSDAERRVAQAELSYRGETRTGSLGLRRARDEDASGARNASNQAIAGTSWQTLNKRLTMRAGTEISFGGAEDNIDYPSRSVVGLDFNVSESTSLFGEYEFGQGSQIDTQMTRIGLRTSPWHRAQLNTTLNQQSTEYGPRTFANLGLIQGWQINERWAVDLGIDQSNTLSAPGAQPFRDDTPLASGSLDGDFLAAYAGGLYRGDFWTINTRLEHRTADTEERWGFLAGFYREEHAGRAFSASARLLDSDFAAAQDTSSAHVRLGWAFRPDASRWAILDRLDLIHEHRQDNAIDEKSYRLVNNFNANWVPNGKTQIGLQYGAKYVGATFDGTLYSGYTDLMGVDFRRDLNRRWDLGVQAGALHSWRSDIYETTIGLDVGVNLATNLWLSVGYNFKGFEDEDFSSSRYTAQGPFVRLRFKADQESLKDALSLVQRRDRSTALAAK